MKNQLVAHFLICLAVGGCATNKYLSTETKPSELTDIAYFEPISYIDYIEKGNEMVRDEDASKETTRLVEVEFDRHKGLTKVTEKIEIEDSLLKNRIEEDIYYLIGQANNKKSVKGLAITPLLDSVMESQGKRFAIGIVSSGFRRSKKNYKGQIAKGVGVGILSLGMAVPTPIKHRTVMFSIIMDSEKNEVCFYKNTLPVESDPNVPVTIKKQIDNLYYNYLFGAK